MAEYKPGTVAIVKHPGYTEPHRAIRLYGPDWIGPGLGTRLLPEQELEILRVLPVIDLDYIRQESFGLPAVLATLRSIRSTQSIADQIEEQMGNPRMPEPQIIGAVVLAAQKGECEGSERMWTRFTLAREHCWIDTSARLRSWDELDHPRPWGQS